MIPMDHLSEKILPYSSENFFVGTSADFIEFYPHKIDYIANCKQFNSDNLTILLIKEYAKLSNTIEINKEHLGDNLVIIVERNAQASLKLCMFPKSISIVGMHESFLRISCEKSTLNNQNIFCSVVQDYASTIELYFSIQSSIASSLHIESYLNQERSSITIGGSYELNGEEKLNIEINQHHKAPLTTSKINVNGVLKNNAVANFSGTITIEPQAHQANAQLSNKNLLLDQNCQATSQPNLEIKTNNVHCKHASAIGYCDQEQLFYMQLRGFTQTAAEQRIIEAFLSVNCSIKP